MTLRTLGSAGLVALALGTWCTAASAAPIYGALSNFDVINDTGVVCRGFEIELEGLLSTDVFYTFGQPYTRYGDPQVVSTAGGVIVRYQATYNGSVWSAGTPISDTSNVLVTGGHQLFDGGDPAWPNVPGDHFGVATNGLPINTLYRWLVEDPVTPGTTIVAGTNVRVPMPQITVTPPAVPANPPKVQVVVAAPPNDTGFEFGDAIWVKVFTTELDHPAVLDDLVVGGDDVPEPAEVEVEWMLLQPGGNSDEVDSGEQQPGAGAEAVSRRYEFYDYAGGYDGETHEALSDEAVLDGFGNPLAPDLGGNIGNFVGGQNAAVNFAAFVPEPASLAMLGLGMLGLMGRRRR